jgi:Carboxypeptidase regulatory-like domain
MRYGLARLLERIPDRRSWQLAAGSRQSRRLLAVRAGTASRVRPAADFAFLATLLLLLTALASVSLAAQVVITQSSPGPAPGGRTGPRNRPPAETGSARLRGRVVGGDTGAPLRRAIVQLSGADVREGRATTTDEDGRWELGDLPAGRYAVTAMKAGYVMMHFGQRRPFEEGRPVEVADNQTIPNIDFNLPRGGVIAGRITDEYGEPVAETNVMALRYRYINGQRKLIPVGRWGSSDDGGNFRIYGLPPGDYYLSADLRAGMLFGAQSDQRTGYASTYYPGVASPQQAEKVTLGVGAEVTGLAFSLAPARTARISGTAIDSQGKPMVGSFVALLDVSNGPSGFMVFGGGNQVRADGSFTLSNVSPGEYILTAQSMGPGPAQEVAMARITVTGEDLSGVTVTASRPASLRGRVLFDVPPPAGSVAPTSVMLGMLASEGEEMMMFGGGPGKVESDWSFELRPSVGPVLLRAFQTPPGYTLKGVYLNGQDITDTGVSFKPGESVTGLQVVLTGRIASVSGRVTDDRSQPAVDYSVVIFSEDSGKWGRFSRHIFRARPDQQGAFQAKPLPPGKYLAVALEYLEEGAHEDPEVLERLRGVATPFTLSEGQQQVLSLRLATY